MSQALSQNIHCLGVGHGFLGPVVGTPLLRGASASFPKSGIYIGQLHKLSNKESNSDALEIDKDNVRFDVTIVTKTHASPRTIGIWAVV
jgi:hypothetical protein